MTNFKFCINKDIKEVMENKTDRSPSVCPLTQDC